MRAPLLTALLALSTATACVHRPSTDAGWPTEIREYVIPDTSAFPNDLAIAADGTVWYTDRATSRIGHLDPETGEIRQHRTPTPASAPYGITIAEDGSVWYAGSRAGVLGRLDPSTGTIAEYHVGEGGPHGVVALGSRIWFTMRRSGSYGWLDRKTLETRRFEFPGSAGHAAQDRGPYALVAGPRGSLWFTAMRTGALFRVDTRDGSLRRFDLGTRGWPRRLAVARNGDVWYGDFPASRLGRLVPSTGKVEEIQLVKRPAEPYGIVVAPDGRIWFNEARNERLMGYDPATDEFRVLVIPTAGAIARGMAVDMERRRIWLPLSGTHRIGRIDLPRARLYFDPSKDTR